MAPVHLRGSRRCKEHLMWTHQTLKSRSRTKSSMDVWKWYTKDEKLLKEYAASMAELATVHWSQKGEVTPEQDRHVWICRKLESYLKAAEFERIRKLEQHFVLSRCPVAKPESFTYPENSVINFEKLRCLDVGSCYNPLSEITFLETLAVDIGPADPSVKRCDFVTVNVGEKLTEEDGAITVLPDSFYDVVVCSLFLDFVPSKTLRWDCCRKLARLVKPEGLLFVVCPDSVETTNGTRDMIKNWRLGLGLLGFSRVYVEKLLHFQCMAFRKVPLSLEIWKEFVLKFLNEGVEVCEPQHLFRTPMDNNKVDQPPRRQGKF